MARTPCWLAPLASLVFASSCTGVIGEIDDTGSSLGPGQTPMGGTGGEPPQVASPDTPLRRLTRTEYNNTIRDLLGDTSQPANAFNPDVADGAFDNNAGALARSALVGSVVDQYDSVVNDVIERALRTGSSTRARLMGCDLDKQGEPCARRAVMAFARRAWRRPVAADEVENVLRAAQDAGGIEETTKVAFRMVLMSPYFLFRFEEDPPAGTGPRRVSPHELIT